MALRWLAKRPWGSLVWCLVGFILCQAGLALALEQRLQQIRDPEYADKLKRLQRCRGQAPGRPLVMMLGSSRTFEGFEAARLSARAQPSPMLAFNFGLTGGCSLLELVCLKRLLAAGIRPDLLLVEVLPAALNQLDDRPLEELWLDGMRLRATEMRLLNSYHTDPMGLLEQWGESRCLPCSFHAAELQQHLGLDVHRPLPDHEGDEVDAYGWRCGFPNGVTAESRRQQTALSQRQYRKTFGEFHLADGPARALHDLLDRCRREHIATALVLMPEGTDFRSWYTPAMRVGLDTFLQNLSQQCQVPLIDARTWVQDDGFRDAHHLIPSGAHVFTDRLLREFIASHQCERGWTPPSPLAPLRLQRSH
jgi:hypothetical protein